MFAGVEVCTILYNHLKNDRRGSGCGGNEGREGMKERKEGRGRGQNTSYYYLEKQHTLWFVPVHAANES